MPRCGAGFEHRTNKRHRHRMDGNRPWQDAGFDLLTYIELTSGVVEYHSIADEPSLQRPRHRPVVHGMEQAEDGERDMTERLHLVVERRLEPGELPDRFVAAEQQHDIVPNDDQAPALLMRNPLGPRRLIDLDKAGIERLQNGCHRSSPQMR